MTTPLPHHTLSASPPPPRARQRRPRRPSATGLLLLALALAFGLAALPAPALEAGIYRRGDVVEPFVLYDYWTNEPIHSEDFTDSILILDFFRESCSHCREAAPLAKQNIEDYYAAQGGNPHGVPVNLLMVNIQNFDYEETDAFLAGLGDVHVADDPFRKAYDLFSRGAVPLYVIINAVRESPTYATWQIAYLDNYQEADMKRIIDSIQPPPAAPPIITSPLNVITLEEEPFYYNFTASGVPETFAATNLPGGLAFDPATRIISGTPAAPGVYEITLETTNQHGTTTRTLHLTVALKVPALTSPATIDATLGDPLEYAIEALYDPTGYAADGLPQGLVLDPETGVISGAPEAPGEFDALLTLTNDRGSAEITLTFLISDRAPAITSDLASSALRDVAYTYTITADFSPDSFIANGLPAGLELDPATGVISGVPQTLGAHQVTIGASNHKGTDYATLVLEVLGAPPVITTEQEAITATLGDAFSLDITAERNPSLFQATDLPKGLKIRSSTGRISGTLEETGVFDIVVTASNLYGADTLEFSLFVNGLIPVITSAASATGSIGLPFSYVITADNSPVVFGAEGLPEGVSVNTDSGSISGTPQAPGSYAVALTALNDWGAGQMTLTLDIQGRAPLLDSADTIPGTVGEPLEYQLLTRYDPETLTLEDLPESLAFDPATGLVSGTPAAPGIFAATLQMANTWGQSSATLTFDIEPAAPDPYLTVAPASHDVPAGGGAFAVQVASNTAWTAIIPPEAADWLSLSGESVAAGENDGELTLDVAENTSPDLRSATLSLAADDHPGVSATHTITQTGKPEDNGGGDDEPDWAALGWFGGFTAVNLPQLWCDPLGWLYTESADTADVTFFCYAIPDIGWFWTAEEVYPWLWTFSGDGDWLYYYDQNWFYSLSQDQNIWIAE